jgi:hypothetical protein
MHHILGDSFVNPNRVDDYRAALDDPNISVSFDGMGGSTLPEQALRLAADVRSHRRLLVIYEGQEVNSAAALAAIADMAEALDHPYWLYVESPFTANQGFDNPSTRATVEQFHADMAAALGDRFVSTYQAFFDAAIGDPEDSGYADDQADIANGVMPRSLRFDDVHPNSAGATVAFTGVKERMGALGWL